MSDRSTTDTRTRTRRIRLSRRTSPVDSNFVVQPNPNQTEINILDSNMSQNSENEPLNTDRNEQSISESRSPGIELPELGDIGFTAGGHRLPVPLRYESSQVHFSTYKNYDSIPSELLSVLLDLDADDAELESEFWMTATGLLAPNTRTRSRLARKVQSEEEGSNIEPLRGL